MRKQSDFSFLIQDDLKNEDEATSKIKVTFFSSTFKVWESKVFLLFLFVAQELRYGHFFFLNSGARFDLSSEEEIAHILASRPQIKKVRILCFLQL